MPAPSAARQRMVSWDVLRVLSVLMVLAYHATFIGPIVERVLQPRQINFPWQVGASSLLMISAYFTAQSLSRADPWRFWWSRISRLLPPFVASVLFTWVVLQLLAPDDWWRPTLKQLGGNLLMLWSVYPRDIGYIDGSYWTLPLQLMAFSVAAVLVACSWRSGRRLWLVLWSAVLVPLAQLPIRQHNPPELYRIVVDTAGCHRMHLFVLGVALWLWSTRRIGHLHGLALGSVCLVAHAVHTAVPGVGVDVGAVVGLAVVLVLACSAARGPDWGRLLPPAAQVGVRWLAGISYGVYLLHQTVGFLVMRWVNHLGAGPLLEVLSMTATSVLLGWLLTHFVERPISRAARRWSPRPTAPKQAPRETVGSSA
ncbi:MAG TPA: acyltransferase [Pseudonocardiaceae bacterium]|jgi:peptidoglycan/LPS O-acetylase OafA/YrhL